MDKSQQIEQALSQIRNGESVSNKNAEIEKKLAEIRSGKTTQTKKTTTQEAKQKKPIYKTLGDIFGGDVIGEAIGTKIAKKKFEKEDFDTGLSPEETRLAEQSFKQRTGRNIDFSSAGIKQDVLESDTFEQPTGKQIAGDIGQIGLTLGSLALPVAKGAQVAKSIPQLAGKGIAKSLGRGGIALGANTALAGATGAGLGATQALKEEGDVGKEALNVGGMSAAITGGVGLAGRALKTVVPQVYKLLASTFSGAPRKAIDNFASNPEASRQALRRAISDDTMVFKIADSAQQAVDNIQAKRTREFTQGLKRIGANNLKLEKNAILNGMQDILETNRIIQNGENAIDQVLSDPTDIRKMTNVIKRINGQKKYDVESLLDLKKYLDNAQNGTPNYNRIVNELNSQLKEQMPQSVKNLLKKSQADELLLQNLKRELGIQRGTQGLDLATEEGKVVVRQNTQRVINALRRAFSDKKQVSPLLLEELERIGGKELIDDISAQFFIDLLPPGGLQSILGLGAGSVAATGAALANPATIGASLPTLALTGSPRAVGNIAIEAGRAGQALNRVTPQLQRAARPSLGLGINQQ